MIIEFQTLTLKNFLSYGAVPTIISLNKPGTTLILGEDLDNTADGKGANGVGKFNSVDSLLKTPQGWTRMGDVTMGQLLQMPDGTTAPISGIFPQGKQPLFKVTFVDGRHTLVGGPHLWKVQSPHINNNDPQILPTTDLLKYVNNEKNDVFIPSIIHPHLPDMPLPVDPFIYGLILSGKCSISVLCNWDSTLVKILKDFNIFSGNDTESSILSDYLDGASYNQKRLLVDGLLFTVSSIDPSIKIFNTSSGNLARDIQYLIRSMGGESSIRELDMTYTVTMRFSKTGIAIDTIIPAFEGEAQCITVDHPDHLYITDDYIVTHNTVILNAFTYVCYDQTISDIQKDNLINNINNKEMEVSIIFNKGKDTFKISRCRKMKSGASGNYVHVFCNNKNITPDSVSNTNALIERIIGIPYDIFVRVVTFSATQLPFLKLPVRSSYGANQTDIIEELFNLNVLTDKSEKLKLLIKDTKTSLTIQTAKVDQYQQEQKRHNNQITSLAQRLLKWNDDTKCEIENVTKKLEQINGIDIDAQQKLHKTAKDITVKLENIQLQCTDAHNKQAQYVSQVDKITSELSHLQHDKCPYCLQKYDNTKQKITQCKTEIGDINIKISKVISMLDALQKNKKVLVDEQDIILSKITVSNIDELITIQNKQSVFKDRISKLSTMHNPFTDPLDELRAVQFDNINTDDINNITKILDHQKFLLKLLTKKDSFIRKALLDQNIPLLNKRLHYYLSALGLAHAVIFTPEMTAGISQFGRPMDFGNLSSGQQARVNLALSFAFRDILMYRTNKVNICILDEVLDVGLDTIGVQYAAQILERKAKDENLSMFIISHRDEINTAFDTTITIQLKKGFSYISTEK